MRHLLPRTYYPFFARFRHPSRIQQEAALPLLEGKGVLLVSATASGKTEAMLAPLVERYFDELKRGQSHLLLVCPTRALVNDLARRLQSPLRGCGLKLKRRTSDASEDPQAEPAALWVTTPEGLDSLISRFPRWVSRTAALVLDEIHLLEGSPRGTQVLCLLERMVHIARAMHLPPPQRVAATATASRPGLLARRFLGEQAEVVEDVRKRVVRLHYEKWISYDGLRDTLADLPGCRKVLLFANSRLEAEEAAAELRGKAPFGNHCWVHHASLSRQLRLSAEQAFLRQDCGLLACTTTMEVGVDIGDVDWVVLLHPPEDRLGFWQRTGRSGRRSGPAQAVACWRSLGDKVRYLYYLQESPSQPLELPGEEEHDSVVPQQAMSLLWQNPRKQLSAGALQQRLPGLLQARWEIEQIEELLASMAEKGWLESAPQGKGLYQPGPRLQRLARLGQLHGNIGGSTQKQLEIRDSSSGKVLGTLQADARGRVPARVRLGGRVHQLRQDRHNKTLLASPLAFEGEAPAPALGPAAPTRLLSSQDLGQWLGLAPRCLLTGPQGNLLGHFLGSHWGQLLKLHLEQNYPGSTFYGDAWVIAWKGSFVDTVWSPEALWGCIQKFSARLRRQMGLGRWFGELPKARQRHELTRLLSWEWVSSSWAMAPWKRPEGDSLDRLKQLLHHESAFTVAGFFPIEAEDL